MSEMIACVLNVNPADLTRPTVNAGSENAGTKENVQNAGLKVTDHGSGDGPYYSCVKYMTRRLIRTRNVTCYIDIGRS